MSISYFLHLWLTTEAVEGDTIGSGSWSVADALETRTACLLTSLRDTREKWSTNQTPASPVLEVTLVWAHAPAYAGIDVRVHTLRAPTLSDKWMDSLIMPNWLSHGSHVDSIGSQGHSSHGSCSKYTLLIVRRELRPGPNHRANPNHRWDLALTNAG